MEPIVRIGNSCRSTPTPSVSARLGGAQEIKVSWRLDSTNGAALRNYTLTVLQGGTEVRTVTLDPGATDWSFTNAQDGVDYRFAVRATNRAGTSKAGTSDAISTFSAPSSPGAGQTAVDETRSYAQGGRITLNWSAPSATGGVGIGITHYELSGYQGRSPAPVTDLTASPQVKPHRHTRCVPAIHAEHAPSGLPCLVPPQ